jgi:hypothetical protein
MAKVVTKKPAASAAKKAAAPVTKKPAPKAAAPVAKQATKPVAKKALSSTPKGFRKVEVVKKYFRYKECSPGDVLVKDGVYIGDTPNQFGRDNHDFRESDGQVVSLNAAGQLDYILQNNVKQGDSVKIVYAGTNKLTSGAYKNKDAHSFEVFVKGAEVEEAATDELEEETTETDEETETSTDELEEETTEESSEGEVDLEDLEG